MGVEAMMVTGKVKAARIVWMAFILTGDVKQCGTDCDM